MNLQLKLAPLYYICMGSRFESRSSHLFTLKVEFLATRLLDKKKPLIENWAIEVMQRKKNPNHLYKPYIVDKQH
jgi:hypothetical protein